MPQSDEMISRSGGMYVSPSRVGAAISSGRLTGKVIFDDADHHLLVLDRLAYRLQVAGTGRAGLEGQRVGFDVIQRLQDWPISPSTGGDRCNSGRSRARDKVRTVDPRKMPEIGFA